MTLFTQVTENLFFVVEFLGIIAALFLIAFILEKHVNRMHGYSGKILTTKKITMIGLFSAASAVLMLVEIPMPFAPPFYKLDLSEVPVLIITFAFGPVAGILTEFCKILLKLLFKPTSTAFVGELANFCVGCSFLLPASITYIWKKTRTHAIAGCIVGTLVMTIFGSGFNAIYLLPKFSQLYGMPLDQIIAMGTKINPSIVSVSTMVMWAVAPLNLLKGSVVSGITMLLYKKLSVIIKADHKMRSDSVSTIKEGV